MTPFRPLCAALTAIFSFSALASATTEIELSPVFGPPTTVARMSGTGFGRIEQVDLSFDGLTIGTAQSWSGVFSTRIEVPATATPGDHRLQARGRTTGRIASAWFRVRTDWAQFGYGPGASRWNPHENVLDGSRASKLQVRWTQNTRSAIEAAPVYRGGTLYVTSTDGWLYAFNPQTGQRLWRFRAQGGIVAAPAGVLLADPGSLIGFNPQPDPPRCVVIGDTTGGLHSIDGETGGLEWSATMGPIVASPLILVGFNPQPDPPAAIVVGTTDGELLSFDEQGRERWSVALGSPIVAAPTGYGGPDAYGGPNAKVLVATLTGQVFSLSAATGKIEWSPRIGAEPTSPVVSAADSRGARTVLVGDTDGNLTAFAGADGSVLWIRRFGSAIPVAPVLVQRDSRASEEIYVLTEGGTVHRLESLDDPTPVWSFSLRTGLSGAPALANGVLYFGAQDQRLRAIDAATGALLFLSTPMSITRGAPIVADGKVWIGTESGAVLAWE